MPTMKQGEAADACRLRKHAVQCAHATTRGRRGSQATCSHKTNKHSTRVTHGFTKSIGGRYDDDSARGISAGSRFCMGSRGDAGARMFTYNN